MVQWSRTLAVLPENRVQFPAQIYGSLQPSITPVACSLLASVGTIHTSGVDKYTEAKYPYT